MIIKKKKGDIAGEVRTDIFGNALGKCSNWEDIFSCPNYPWCAVMVKTLLSPRPRDNERERVGERESGERMREKRKTRER